MDGAAVPDPDHLCRFFPFHLRDENDGQPSPDAFKASKRRLSVYHVVEAEKITPLGELCFGSLAGHGEAILAAGAFKAMARRVMDRPNRPKGVPGDLSGLKYRPPNFDVPDIVWRPSDVAFGWETWKEAHVNVETSSGNPEFPLGYRAMLAMECDVSRDPEPMEPVA